MSFDGEDVGDGLGPPDPSSAAGGLAGAVALRDSLRRRARRRRTQAANKAGAPPPASPLDPPEGPEADVFLRKQSQLLDIQIADLHEQRHLQIAYLRLRRWTETSKLLLQILTAVVGVGIAALFGVLILDAANDRALVIEPIRAPPEFAQRGLDGTALATQLLDRLRAMEDATDSARARQTYTHDWGQDIKVEIPQTGVSIGELRRVLRVWLGHETRISSELFRGWRPPEAGKTDKTNDGLFLTVRAGSAAGQTVSGGEADLDGMMQQAAERLFAVTQPYRHAIYLARQGRIDDALVAVQKLAATGSAEDRPWAYASWGGLIAIKTGDVRAAEAKTRAALKLDPDQGLALDNLAGDEATLGHEQAAIEGYRTVVTTLGSQRARNLAEPVRPIFLRWAELRLSAGAGDWADVARRAEALQRQADYDGSVDGALIAQAAALANAHEVSASRALLAGEPGQTGEQAFARSLAWEPALNAPLTQLRALEDWKGVAALLDGAERWGGGAAFARTVVRIRLLPWLAYARAKTGDVKGGEALLAGLPADCDLCQRMRARIAALRGDPATAERLLGEIIARSPSLPFALLDRARLRLERGDLAGASADARAAHEIAPRYADALELWGEALLRSRDAREAARRFSEAALFAPRWGRLHLMWGQALATGGDRAKAVAMWRRATWEDLNPADRAAATAFIAR